MKKFIASLLASVVCVFGICTFSGCSEVAEVLDLAFENDLLTAENEQLKVENDELKELIEQLEVENTTFKFYDEYPNAVIGTEDLVELTKVNLAVADDTAGDALTVEGSAQVTINGGCYNGGKTPFGTAGNTAVWVRSADAKVVINDGYFYIEGLSSDEDGNKDTGHIDLIYCSAGTIEINGGYFEGADSDVWLLNCKDAAYKDGTAKIVVKGGTFVNFDPSNCISEGETTNFVAEGYVVVSEVFNKDTAEEYTLYTVVEAESSDEVIEL